MSATGPLVHSFTAHFVERWNFVKKNKYEHDARYAFLPPYTANMPSVGDQAQTLAHRFADSLHITLPDALTNTGGIPAQLCRSATTWSQGIEREKSIQNAYIDLITHATRTALVHVTNSRFYLY